MTNRNILNSAVSLISEATDANTPEDYAERAPYILATFCNQCKRLHQKYNLALQLNYTSYSEHAFLDLSDSFPLLPALVPAATYYLAAMLVIDENETLSDKLFDLYASEVASLSAEADAILNAPTPEPEPEPEPAPEPPIPAVLETIVNKY